ncbi:clasp N terminal-domain-containing protein [Suillus clintonianus]|uniref:clasp N terminal-domain-containing protein n=1 Tax=Suillus clintonianus TaxID=1904413 RepID=UPI001B85F156|nr:clasp N terminal-domain-containing protein [Suillus clintonianus]KAG2152962.1 clasp N terminal-domain-containing protein [Suillus clintonianus]
MSTERLEKLINQCKSNDVDQKVDAVTKLQAEFESGIEITEPEPVISALKACLRISNQHLTTATLSALPPLLPLIVSRNTVVANGSVHPLSASSSTSSTAGASHDLMVLRQLMNAFLPAPGIIERLGDTREKARDKARETLVILGGLAFRAASKMKDGKGGPETPFAIFERFFRDNGFGSKVARVREQSLLALVHIRRTHHLFPLRPYLSLLVDTLEDTDGNVRACATPSVIELFTGPGVTDAARSDLKKELTKKGVRKAMVDNIQSQLMHSSRSTGASTPQSEGSAGSGEPLAKKEYVPPSMMLQQNRRPTVGAASGATPGMTRATSQGNAREIPRPASRAAVASPPLSQPSSEAASTIEPAFVASSRDLENEFLTFAKSFEGKETEHNWAARERAIQRVRGMLSGNIHIRYPDVFLQCLKDGFMQFSLKTLVSLRTTVSANTCSLYAELAIALGLGIDPFCEMLYTNLLRMAGFTKKIAAQQSQRSLSVIMEHASAHPRVLLSLLWNTLQEKTVQSRSFAVSHITHYIQIHGTRAKLYIEANGGLEILEKSMKKALADPNAAVRETARSAFWVFDGVWHDRATVILESLDLTARKQLEKVCPDPEVIANFPATAPTTPSLKKSSVAAAIAASRAKAKAIATAPPTLRHQATSSSHATRATSPPARRVVSPISPTVKLSNGRSSPSPVSRSSLSPRSSFSPLTPSKSRVLGGTMPRSVSSSAVLASHSRSSTDSSLSSSPEANRRRGSSPLVPPISPSRLSTTRKTMQPPLSSSYHESPTPRRHAPPVPPVPVPVRQSTTMPDINDEESLLLATVIPIPDDSDSEMDDDSVNLMSFSTPYKVYPPAPSQQRSFSPRSDRSTPYTSTDALSNGKSSEPAPVEDALIARAEQAQSAAERLLELNDPDGEDNQHSTIPPSLLLGSGSATPKPKAQNAPAIIRSLAPPVTPENRTAAIFRQAALFKNSPANIRAADNLVKPVQDQVHETGWWLKRTSTLGHATPLRATAADDRVQELNDYITALESDQTDIRVLQKLALLCSSNPISEMTSPLSPGLGLPSTVSPFLGISRSLPPLVPDIWTKDKSFERLFNALIKFLDPSRDAEQLEYGLIVLWELLSSQAPFVEGREADIFATLFTVRYCNAIDVLEATKTIRDALATRIEPVYGLTTMHGSLRAFLAEPSSDASAKDASHAFGLIAVGKFIMRLPAEVLEEELPRLKSTLMTALNDTTLVIREAVYATIIAAQLVLRDETHLFTLLDGLDDNKKNLLTYYFDKHDARDLGVNGNGVGMMKLEGQMGRLDKLMNTPQKGRASE